MESRCKKHKAKKQTNKKQRKAGARNIKTAVKTEKRVFSGDEQSRFRGNTGKQTLAETDKHMPYKEDGKMHGNTGTRGFH